MTFVAAMPGKSSSSSPFPDVPPVSDDAFYEELLQSCTRKLESIEEKRDEEKELRYSMLGIPLPETEERTRNLEVRGIARFHLADKAGARAAEVRAQALQDLLAAQAVRPLVPEAAGIVKKLEAPELAEQQEPEHAKQPALTGSEADLSESPVNGTTFSKPSFDSAAPASKPSGTRAATATKPSIANAGTAAETSGGYTATASKPALAKSAAASSAGAATNPKNSVDDTATFKPSEADAPESLLDIDTQHSTKGIVIFASPADGVEVDVADGTLRFSKGGKNWDVPVTGTVTGVRRRRGRLEVSVAGQEREAE